MTLRDYTKLKSAAKIGENQVSNDLEDNLLAYYNWAFLGIGNFVNVDVPTSGAFGGLYSSLRVANDQSYGSGQVWESARKDWVWETGIEYTGTSPLPVTGVIVNGVSYPPSDPTYGYSINYPLGRIVFDTAIPVSSTVSAKYSYKWVQFYKGDDAPWLEEIQFASFRPDNVQFTQLSAGVWAVGSQHRLQLPCVVVETAPKGNSARGYQLGDGSLIVSRDVLFHVCAESKRERSRITDIIANNIDKVILMYDVDEIAKNEDYPLDMNGELQGSKMYPQLVQEYVTRQCWMKKAVLSDIRTYSPYFHFSTIRVTCEVILSDVPNP